MKQRHHQSTGFVLILALIAIVAIAAGFIEKENSAISTFPNDKIEDSIASVAAFKQVYKVLMSPRCMNCHPAGDAPLQGNDSHAHAMGPKRGKDGKGIRNEMWKLPSTYQYCRHTYTAWQS